MPGLPVTCRFCTSAMAVMRVRECICSRRKWPVAAFLGCQNAARAAAAAARDQRWVRDHTAAAPMQTMRNTLASNALLHWQKCLVKMSMLHIT